jgi:hypothetical protein
LCTGESTYLLALLLLMLLVLHRQSHPQPAHQATGSVLQVQSVLSLLLQ